MESEGLFAKQPTVIVLEKVPSCVLPVRVMLSSISSSSSQYATLQRTGIPSTGSRTSQVLRCLRMVAWQSPVCQSTQKRVYYYVCDARGGRPIIKRPHLPSGRASFHLNFDMTSLPSPSRLIAANIPSSSQAQACHRTYKTLGKRPSRQTAWDHSPGLRTRRPHCLM